MLKDASLYIHVPFCAGKKCAYCDFYSVPLLQSEKLPRYVTTLLAEAERLFETFRPRQVPTIYIGGGTPSVLGAEGIRALLRGVLDIIGRYASAPEEITVEANPESAGEEFLSAVREAGATRLSLGVQTFHAPSRRSVNRAGSPSLLCERLRLASSFFPSALSVDLISGLPFQSETVLAEDIAAALAHNPVHVSLYALTVESGTALSARSRAGKGPPLPDRDEADRLWITGRDALEKAGYAQYEISNFGKNGRVSLHNLRYWRMRNWLALGPAASGTLFNEEEGRGSRYTIPSDVNAWLEESGAVFGGGGLEGVVEKLDTQTLIKETFLMGFRLREGPEEGLFLRRFGKEIGEYIPKTAASWREAGFLREDKYALTKDGLLFLDRFLLDAFAELDDADASAPTLSFPIGKRLAETHDAGASKR